MKPNVEILETRAVPSTGYDLGGGLLFVRGDNLGNALAVRADQTGAIHVSERGVDIPIFGLTPTVQNTALVAVQSGTGAANILAVDGSLGQLPVLLDGRLGGDTLFAESPGTAANELAGSGQVFHLELPVAVPAVQISLNDEGPNSHAVDVLASQLGVTGPAPLTRAQEAQIALNWAMFDEQMFLLFNIQSN
jgi:hypothetical protein